MNAPIVSFTHVGKSFDVDGFELEAIREFNLGIAEGEFVAIVGLKSRRSETREKPTMWKRSTSATTSSCR